MTAIISEQNFTAESHTTHYLAAGPEDGPLVIFVHGWPELSRSWRHQLPALASLGFRAVAPDMRGYGGSTVYDEHEAYAQEHVVADMLRLLGHLGRDAAVWVGHDWGSPTVWSLASHHPERCIAVANLCVPYAVLDQGLDTAIGLVDRSLYPESEFPAGQWEYQLFYQESFDRAQAVFDANPYLTVKALFRKGKAQAMGKPAPTAYARQQGGWFRGAAEAPDLPRDPDVVTEADLEVYAEALARNSFFGPCSYYMNHEANRAYMAKSRNQGRLDLPVLFLHGRYDSTCETVASRLAEPMRERCTDLEEKILDSGHWMAQERPREVNAALVGWLARKVPEHWPS